MKKKLFSALLFSGELCVLLDVTLALFGHALPVWGFLAVFSVLFLLPLLWKRVSPRMLRIAALSLLLLCLLALLLLFLSWRSFSGSSQYADADMGKSDVYAGKNVMVFVPHEDDDINLLGGVFEEYIKYGSTVRVVFATNGDFAGLGETRLREAISALGAVGIPEENIFFLGYGDSWQDLSSIYYASPEAICTSYNGRTETYGLPDHPAYHDGAPYTRSNYVGDIVSILEEYRPDTVFCSDMDFHTDHETLSLLFEEALGILLSKEAEYTPSVFKGFAYITSHYAEDDFYSDENILSTRNPSSEEYLTPSNLFRWSDRFRFPVCASAVSRSLFTSKVYEETALYRSQYFHQIAGRIVNGDKVFWQRETGSLLYNASFSVSSGDGSRLNDFCLLASDDPAYELGAPYGGLWIPEENDALKEAAITLDSPVDIERIVLYDACSLSDNILDAEILFPDGTSLHTGALNADGSGTEIPVRRENLSSFTVRILASEGDAAGLSEIEAYSSDYESPFSMIKLTDSSGDFVYDYWLSASSEAFTLYSIGASSDWADYRVLCSGAGCSAEVQNGELVVSCPKGRACTVTVESISDPSLSDTVFLSNPGFFGRLGQRTEAFLYRNYSRLQDTAAYAILRWGYHLFREDPIVL